MDLLLSALAVLASLWLILIAQVGSSFLGFRLAGLQIVGVRLGVGGGRTWALRGGGTLRVGLVPLGGSVQAAGAEPEDEEIIRPGKRALREVPAWQQAILQLVGPAGGFALAGALMLAGGAEDAIRILQAPIAAAAATLARPAAFPEHLWGPVRMGLWMADASRQGLGPWRHATATAAFDLSLITLLPLPLLSGGSALVHAAAWARGRAVHGSRLVAAAVGSVLVMLLGLAALTIGDLLWLAS